ncbi:MAG: hypothetical protein KJN62_02785 [Deltaproteobacteria bacterium]|nr:hypothetical protein [Deltaproteobacteria bacterium]
MTLKNLKPKILFLIERILAGFSDKIIVINKKQKNDICYRYKIADEKKVRILIIFLMSYLLPIALNICIFEGIPLLDDK